MKKPKRTEYPAMPANYPTVTVEQAIADGTEPWTLRAVANRLYRIHPRQASALRRVAMQLAAENDNRRNRRAA